MATWWDQDINQSQPPAQGNWWSEDAILIEDTGQSPILSGLSAAGRGLASVPIGVAGGLGALGSIVGLDDNVLQRSAQSLQETVQEALPVNPIYGESAGVKVAETLGQAAGQLATLPVGGLAGRLVGGAAGLTRGAQAAGLGAGGLMGAYSGEQTADRLGIENRAQRAAMILGQAGIELGTEMLGGFGTKEFTEGVLGRIPSFLQEQGLRGIARTALQEGGEEAIAGTASPLLERAVLLGEEAPSGEELTPLPILTAEGTSNVIEQGLLGAVAGGFMGGVQNFMSRPDAQQVNNWRLQARARINELNNAPQLTESEQGELTQLQDGDLKAAQWLQDNSQSLVPEGQDNPFTVERTTAAIDEALTPPDPQTEAIIQEAASDPVVEIATEAADEAAVTGAPLTAETLNRQAEVKAVNNAVTIEQAEEQFNQLTQPLPEQVQLQEDLDVEQAAQQAAAAVREGRYEDLVTLTQVINEQRQRAIQREQAQRQGPESTQEVSLESEAPVTTTLPNQTIDQIDETSTQTIPSSVTSQQQNNNVEIGVQGIAEDLRDVPAGRLAELPATSDFISITEGDVGEVSTPSSQSPEKALPSRPSFETALRSEVSNLPKWTEDRIREAVNWFDSGRQGNPPWGVGPVNRAILAVDQQAREQRDQWEQAELAKLKRQRSEDSAFTDVSDQEAKRQIESRKETLREIPASELSASVSVDDFSDYHDRELITTVNELKNVIDGFTTENLEVIGNIRQESAHISDPQAYQDYFTNLSVNRPDDYRAFIRLQELRARLSSMENELVNRGYTEFDVPVNISPRASEAGSRESSREGGISKQSYQSILKAWLGITANTDSFRYETSTQRDPEKLAEEMSNYRAAADIDDEAGTITLWGPNGSLTIEDYKSDKPYIYAAVAESQGKKQGGGALLYQIAFAWAKNNNKTIYPSESLSFINSFVRRTSNMLSSALRYNSTDHMIPDKDQGVPGWKKGDPENIARLAWRESSQVMRAIPDAKSIRYDFANGEFYTLENAQRRIVTDQYLENLVDRNLQGGYANALGIGETTLKRAIITRSAALGGFENINAPVERLLYSNNRGTGATREVAQQALEDFRKTEIGKRIADGVVIAQNVEDLKNIKSSSPYSDSVYNAVQGWEGFFIPSTGESVILLDNIAKLRGESDLKNVQRVIFHERVFHGGFQWMADNSLLFNRKARQLLKALPQSVKEEFRNYPGVNLNDFTVLQEYLARKLQSEDPVELAKADPFFKRLWNAIKDFIAEVFGITDQEYIERTARKIARDIINKKEAFGNQARGNDSDDVNPNASIPAPWVSRNEVNFTTQRLLDDGVSQDQIALSQQLGMEGDQAYAVQGLKPQADWLKSQIWNGGVDDEGSPLVNDENTLAFWRENDRASSDPNWASNLIAGFREVASQSTDPNVRANRGETTAAMAQMELANYAQLMAASKHPDALQAVERAMRYANDFILGQYITMSGAARLLAVRSAAARGTADGLGFWKGLEVLADARRKAVQDAVGINRADDIQNKVNNPEDQDIDTPDAEIPEVEVPVQPRINVSDEAALFEWRPALEKDGADRIADAFLGIFDPPSSIQQGPLNEANNFLNRTLNQILNESIARLNIRPPSQGESIEQTRRRIITELGLDDLKGGKVREVDEIVKERIAELSVDDPAAAQVMLNHWEQVSSGIRNNSISGATSRRVIYDALKQRQEQGNPIFNIRDLSKLSNERLKAESDALIEEVITGLRDQSRVTSPTGEVTTIDESSLDNARKALRSTIDYMVADQRARAAQAAIKRQERQAAEQAKRPTKEAQRIIDRIDESQVESLGPENNKSKVRRLKEEAISSQLTERTRPGHLTREQFINRYTQGFTSLGVDADVSRVLATRLYDENIKLRANQFIREMDSNVRHGGTKGLVKEMLENQVDINDPAKINELMIPWLQENGLTLEQAQRFADRHRAEFVKKLVQAKEKALDKAVKGLKTIKEPTVEKIRQAIRQGSFDQSQGVLNAIADGLGASDLNASDLQQLAKADMAMRGASPTEFLIQLGKMRDILTKRSPDITTRERITQAWVLSSLSAMGTQSLGVTVPFFNMMARMGLQIGESTYNGLRGVIPKREIPNAIFQTVSDYIEGYKGWVSGFSTYWKNDATTMYHTENLGHLNNLREDLRRQIERFKTASPLERVKATFKIAQSSTDIVRRVMNSVDGAASGVFKTVFTRKAARDFLTRNGLTLGEVGLVFEEATRYGQEYADMVHTREGYDSDVSAQIAIDKTNQYVYDYVANRFGGTSASEIRDFADKEARYELGMPDKEVAASWDVFNLVGGMIQGATAYFSRVNPLLGRMILGFTGVPINLANRSLSYTPYGLLRLHWKNKELAKGDNNLYLESMGNSLLRRQRKVEGVAGTVAMLLLAALAYASADDEDYTGVRFTLNGPKDPSLRDAWLKNGWKPNAITWVVNGKPKASLSYGRGGPESLKFPLIALGALNDMQLNGELGEGSVMDHSAAWAKSAATGILESSSYFGLKNVAQVLNLGDAKASEASIAGQVAWTTSSFIPWSGLSKSITRPFVGQLDQTSANAAIIAQMPILGALLGDPAINALGDRRGPDPVDLFTKASDRAYLVGLPLQLTLDPDSVNARAYDLFIRKGSAPSIPSRSRLVTSNGFITDSQWRRYIRVRGNYIKSELAQRYTELFAMSRAEFEKEISSISGSATRQAKEALGLQ